MSFFYGVNKEVLPLKVSLHFTIVFISWCFFVENVGPSHCSLFIPLCFYCCFLVLIFNL